MLPRVRPWVPLPLPGAPRRMKVWYFMGTFTYTTKGQRNSSTDLDGSDLARRISHGTRPDHGAEPSPYPLPCQGSICLAPKARRPKAGRRGDNSSNFKKQTPEASRTLAGGANHRFSTQNAA